MKKMSLFWKIIIYILLSSIGFTFLLPFLWMLSTSLKTDDQLFVYPPKWIPRPIKWQNYYRAISYLPFPRYLRNTLIITLTSMVGVIFSSSLVAYSFAKLRFPDRNLLFILLLSTMMLPGQVTMVPVFILFRTLGWVDTFYPLIIPAFFGNAFFIFLLRQFFLTIPQELIDAARIDGCPEIKIFSNIVLPLSKPALTTVGIFSFMGGWNDFLGPLIYLFSEEKKTLALGLQSFQSLHASEWTLLMAASVLMILPVLIIFFFAQRYFIQGITLTGIKA